MSTPYTIHVGQRLTDYSGVDVTVARVAAGGMGIVAMGPDRGNNGQWRALKTINPEALRRNPDLRERFIREGLIWRGLWPHANILSMQFIIKIDGQPFLVLDYAEHGSLADLLKLGRMTLGTALMTAQHIASGLVALHMPDLDHMRPDPIVHRDLKPDNVLINEISGIQFAQITDFGLVGLLPQIEEVPIIEDAVNVDATRSARFHTYQGSIMGTTAYMAPEQWHDMTLAGPPVDVYALGLILAQCITDTHPLLSVDGRQHSVAQWRAAHAQGTPQRLQSIRPEVPIPLEQLYLSMLAKRPEDRPTAQQVLVDINTVAQRLSFPSYRPPETYADTPEHEMIYWHGWASAYTYFEIYPEALVRNNRAYQLAPHHPSVLLSRGDILKGMQHKVKALACYEAALQVLFPEDHHRHNVAYNQIGVIYSEQEQYAAAEAAYAQALTEMPDAANTWRNRGRNEANWGLDQANNGQHEAARKHLQQARDYTQRSWALNPTNTDTPELLAAIAEAMREVE